jgi:phosphatidylglycerol lysyltransferase
MAGVALDVRISLLRQHGSFSQAYSASFQAGLEHFGDEQGFIAYKMVGRTAMVLSDPVAPPQYHDRLICRFLREQHDACFCQVSYPVAKLLSSLGFFVNQIGCDNRIDLAGYDFSGRGKRNLRNSANRMVSLGHVIRECSIAEVGVDAVQAVSDAWKRTHTIRNREVTFMSRPMVWSEERDVRWLFTFDRGSRLVAFGVFDPVYELGQIVGYTSQANRHLPEADSLVQHAIKRRAIETFKAEGRKWLFLGLSPFADIHDWEFRHNWLVRRAFVFANRNALFNRFVYPVKYICEHKSQFRGVTHQTYFAFDKLPSVPRLLKLYRACNIF